MKKIIYVFFFIISASTFCRSEKLILVDYSYILDNYYKTLSYNKTLHNLRDKLEKKYNIKFNDKNTDENKEKALNIYKTIKTKFTNEITTDIDIAIAFAGQTENYNLICEKSIVHYGKGKDISKSILKFLNNVYFHELTIKNEKKLQSDLFPTV